MWQFRKLGEGEPERSPHEAEFFNVGDLDASAALIREAIQNSLDARLNGNEPVHIRISLNSEPRSGRNSYYSELLDHVKSCEFKLDSALKGPFTYLIIEDFGTRGLDGPISRTEVTGDKKSNYYNLWWREGISKKEGRDAGRWGLGKTVFFVCSELRSFWGYTVRHDDNRHLLLGKALLKSHIHDGSHYDYYGYYCVGENQPIEDPKQIATFKNRFRIFRNDEPGLSIVIPFPIADISRDNLLKASIQHYFYSIIKGLLTIDICQNDTILSLDKKTIFDIAHDIDWKGTTWEHHPVSNLLYFIYNSVKATEEHFFTLQESNPPKISDTLFGEDLEGARALFSEGKLVPIKVPVQIQPVSGEKIKSHFKVFIQKDEQLQRVEEFYIRSGISISEIRLLRGVNLRALLTAEEEPVARFLGDSESPAHTDWKERSETFKQRYHNAVSTLRYIRTSLRDITPILNVPPPGVDPDFLKDIFYVREEQGKAAGDNPVSTIPPDLQKSVGVFSITSQDGGFRLSLADKQTFEPFTARIEVAYDTKKGNPFARYDPWDFKFDTSNTGYGKIIPRVKGAQIKKMEYNMLLLSIEDPKFELKTAGFDKNRDLVVAVKKVSA
jgi:hypothetical protein